MSAFLLPNAGGGQEPDRVRHSRLVDIYTCTRADIDRTEKVGTAALIFYEMKLLD